MTPKKMTPPVLFVMFIIMAQSNLVAQVSYPSRLFLDSWSEIPSPTISEPFPWGLEPIPSGKEGIAGQISEYAYASDYFVYKYGDKGTDSSYKVAYKTGSVNGDFFVDGKPISWTENGSRLVWDEYSEKLYQWKGSWASPDFIYVYNKGNPEPYSKIEKIPESKDRWKYSDTDGHGEITVKSTTGGVTKWTTYDSESGEPKARLATQKDAKGAVIKCEYWSSVETKAWDISLIKSDAGATIKGSEGSDSTTTAVFSKNLAPKSIQIKNKDDTTIIEYTVDAKGKVVEWKKTMNGKVEKKVAFKVDVNGNIVERIASEPTTAFGETSFRETNFVKQTFTYFTKGMILPTAERPESLDEWLTPEAITEDTSETPEEVTALPLTDTQKLVGKWEGTLYIFSVLIKMYPNMTCSWEGLLALDGTYEVNETKKEIVFYTNSGITLSNGYPTGQSQMSVTYNFVDNDTMELMIEAILYDSKFIVKRQ